MMNATISVVCYKYKILKNGEHPLMIRVSKNQKTKYKSLGISVHPDHWDFKTNRPLPKCPNRELILKTILEKEADFQKEILELTSMQKEYTAASLLAAKNGSLEYKGRSCKTGKAVIHRQSIERSTKSMSLAGGKTK